MTEKLDEIVEVIAKRVSARLQEMGVAPQLAVAGCVGGASCISCGLCVEKKPEAVNNIVSFGAARIGANPGISAQVDTKLASMIDHTLLKPDVTREELLKVCN